MIAPLLARSSFLLFVFAAACGDDTAADATTGASPTTTGGGASGGVGGGTGGAGASGGAGAGGFGGIPIDDGDWTCLGNVEYPLPTSPSVTLNLTAVVITNGGPIADVAVSACAAGDATCATPITSGTTDRMGAVSLTVPTGTVGFDGYFMGTGATIPDSYVFRFPPVASDVDTTLRLIDNGALSLLSTLFGIDSDPTRGHLGVAIQDCALEAAAAMTVSVDAADAETTTLYVKGDLPDASAQTTDESGVVSLFNVPPGTATVTATRVSTGEVIGSVVVTIVAGAVTYATLPPT
jgi:hypothetical protein